MQITEQQLFKIILEEINNLDELGNYSAAAGASIRSAQLAGNRDVKTTFLEPAENDTIPVSDNIIKAIVSLTSKEDLNEQILSDDIKERIRNLVDKLGGGSDAVLKVAKRLAIPVALVASVVGGGLTGAYLASGSEADADASEFQVQDTEELGFTDVFGSGLYDEKFSGMDRFEVSDELWSQYDLNISNLDNAPVSSSVWIYKYKMVPSEEISPSDVLPLSGAAAQDYYNALKNRVDENPMVELPLLKKMVYGDVGKWSGGTGNPNQNFKVAEDGSQILPPDWTVAYTLYADLMEEKTIQLMDYYIDNPDDRQELYQMLGVKDRDEFNKFIQDTMYKIGRPMEAR